ncbi:MAG: zinc transporter ZntB [Amphiplicatus sp.]
MTAPIRSDFDQGPPFVFGFGFRDGQAAEAVWPEIAAQTGAYDFVWLHLNMNNAETQGWIREKSGLPHVAASALLAGETRPRMTRFDKGLVVNLRGVNLNEAAEPEDMVSIRVWLDEKRVITTRRRRLKSAQDVRQQIIDGAVPASPGALVARLAARLTERMEPHVLSIDEDVDAREEAMLKGEGEQLRARLADARQTAVMFRRFIAPQREALARLASEESALFDPPTRSELREIADSVTRLTEEIDAARERAMVLQDQLADQRAEQMNRNMMILSVVAAIFLPLGFLTGLFGINVGGMPGVDSPAAFWLVVAASLAIGLGLAAFFRGRGWL